MKYLQLFESYLKSGKAPLYHMTNSFSLSRILEDDKLKCGVSVIDRYKKRRNDKDFTKSVSFTRFANFNKAEVRLVLDRDSMNINGIKIYPFCEIGTKASLSSGWYPKYKQHKKIKIHHNIDSLRKKTIADWEIEGEERMDGDLENLGKYLIQIDVSKEMYEKFEEKFIDYINKYPHIEIGLLDYSNVYLGGEKVKSKKTDSVIVLNKEIIDKKLKELVTQ